MAEASDMASGDKSPTAGEVRSCHPAAYRSGQWAEIVMTLRASPDSGFHCWMVRWPDGDIDWWRIEDPDANYEFRQAKAPEWAGAHKP